MRHEALISTASWGYGAGGAGGAGGAVLCFYKQVYTLLFRVDILELTTYNKIILPGGEKNINCQR